MNAINDIKIAINILSKKRKFLGRKNDFYLSGRLTSFACSYIYIYIYIVTNRDVVRMRERDILCKSTDKSTKTKILKKKLPQTNFQI